MSGASPPPHQENPSPAALVGNSPCRPDEWNAPIGAMTLALGTLTPGEEVIHWGTHDARELPANGLIGLRVTVVAHEFESGGSGNAHIDWKKAQPAVSTTRRRLTSE